MRSNITVLLAGRSKEPIESLARLLTEQSNFKVETRHISNGHADPLWGLERYPDVVVMLLGAGGEGDLDALIEAQAPERPPFVVLAENGDAQTMRLAMRAGARDFLPGAVTAEELIESIERVSAEAADKAASDGQRQLTAFVNAKGGSGATFIACNVAHILASSSKLKTALLSLDLQFESLAQYFDTDLRHGLMQALETVDSLDTVALDAFMTHHHSGLRMLAAQSEDVIKCHADKAERLATLLDKMTAQYAHVIVDIPRRVDTYVVPVLEKASRIVLVAQQTLGHLRDASRMLQIFRAYGVSLDQVLVIVNRYDKNAAISKEDISRALPGTDLAIVPSDFKTVADSINLGIPMHEHARGSAVTKALLALESKISGTEAPAAAGLIGKAFSSILRKKEWLHA